MAMRTLCLSLFIGLTHAILAASPGHASDLIILTSPSTPHYQESIESFRRHLPSQVHTETLSLDGRLEQARSIGEYIRASHPKLVFAVGLKAAVTAKTQFPNTPTLFAMVVNPGDHELPSGRMVGISQQPPVHVQIEHIHALAPAAQRIGILYDGSKRNLFVQEAQFTAKKLSLQILVRPITRREDVAEALHAMVPSIDLLWVIQDSTILSEETVDTMLRSTLRHKIPIFTFSASLVKRGALGALTVSPTAAGQQAALLAQKMLKQEGPPLPSLVEPDYSELAINLNTAEYLGLTPARDVVRTAGIVIGGPGDMAKQEQNLLQDLFQ